MKREHLKEYIPPAMIRVLKRSRLINRGIFWEGDFSNWDEALGSSLGYDSNEIIEKVKRSLIKVKNGEAAFERDSVVFDKVEYDWPVVAVLMWITVLHKGSLNVMDFGGSLGSLYYQSKRFLMDIDKLNWNIVEQENFVKCGKEFFADDVLKFYYDTKICLRENEVNLVILSSVLPYIQDPYALLDNLLKEDLKYIFIDKMPLIDKEVDRITVQKVPASIYKASYPAWFFSKQKFMKFVESKFEIIADFDREIITNLPATFKGFLLLKR